MTSEEMDDARETLAAAIKDTIGDRLWRYNEELGLPQCTDRFIAEAEDGDVPNSTTVVFQFEGDLIGEAIVRFGAADHETRAVDDDG